MKALNSLILIPFFLLSLSTFGEEKKEEKKTHEVDPYGLVTCSTKDENRTLAIMTKEEGGCELHYEKYGKDKVISWSSSSVTPCMNSRLKVRKELEAAGWKCFQE